MNKETIKENKIRGGRSEEVHRSKATYNRKRDKKLIEKRIKDLLK